MKNIIISPNDDIPIELIGIVKSNQTEIHKAEDQYFEIGKKRILLIEHNTAGLIIMATFNIKSVLWFITQGNDKLIYHIN